MNYLLVGISLRFCILFQLLMVIYFDYMLHSGDFFSSSLFKLSIIWAVAAVVDVAVFQVTSSRL